MGHRLLSSRSSSRQTSLYALPIVLLACGLVYFYNLGGWLVADDEGTDLYEIWRLSEGDVPGVDLVTEQPPVFLLAGVGLGLLSDFDVVVLRGASAALVLGSAWLIFLLGREIWSPRVGLLATALYLLNHLVYTQARLFRPDAWMLAFSVLGLYLFVLAHTRSKRLYIPLAGVAYALGVLCKLFGVLPLGGCLLFLTYQVLAGRTSFRRSLEDVVLLLVPFLAISVGGILAFYPPDSDFYKSVLGQHWQLHGQKGLAYRVVKGAVVMAWFLRHNLGLLFALPLLHHLAVSSNPGERVLAWQIPSGLAFFALSRPIFPRYWLYLIPVFCLILGNLINRLMGWIESRKGSWGRFLTIASGTLLVGLGVAQSVPTILRHAQRHEDDTLALAAYIAAHTAPNEAVLSDYASLNFHARRPSVYQASIIAQGRITGGMVIGADLIAEIEARNVKMVALHVPGGTSPPSHLIHLQDYAEFYTYLNQHFCLTDTFERAGQVFEIYQTCPAGRK